VCAQKIETNQVLGHENLQFITKRVKVEGKEEENSKGTCANSNEKENITN
jgi:hypothetical protein